MLRGRLGEKFGKVMILKRGATLGWISNDDEDVTILNRLIDLQCHDGARPKTRIFLERNTWLECGSRLVSTLGDKKSEHEGDAPLEQPDLTAFRSATMRSAFIAAHTPVFGFDAKRLARYLSKPTTGAWNRLERCV